MKVVFCTNRIESNWVRFEFDLIESRIEFERFKFEWFEFDSIWLNSIQFDSIWLNLTRIDSNSIQIWLIQIWFRFDLIRTESNFINSDSIWFELNRISSIQIRFADHKSELNLNWIWIWFDLTNRLQNPNHVSLFHYNPLHIRERLPHN